MAPSSLVTIRVLCPFILIFLAPYLVTSTAANNDMVLAGGLVSTPNQSIPGEDGNRALNYENDVFNAEVELWPENELTGWPTVPYILNIADEKIKEVAETAIRMWSEKTCIDFVISDGDKIYVEFTQHETYCRVEYPGQAGFLDDPQHIYISPRCKKDLVGQNLGTILGFQPGISRKDFDEHILTNKEQLADGTEHVFDMLKDKEDTYGIPLDYSSFMLGITGTDYSKSGDLTFLTPDLKYQGLLGRNKEGPTHRDLHHINKKYGCIEKFVEKCGKPDSCKNEGFLGKDCECICRQGTDGVNCENIIDERNNDYYGHILPNCSLDFTEETMIETPHYPDIVPKDTWCVYKIFAPEDKEVHMHFENIKTKPIGEGCRESFIVITNTSVLDNNMICPNTNAIYNFDVKNNEVGIYFDFRTEGASGFQVHFRFQDFVVPDKHDNKTIACIKVITDDTIIRTPNYPEEEVEGTMCEYQILTLPRKKIIVEFISFLIEKTELCKSAYLEILDDYGTMSKKYCDTAALGTEYSTTDQELTLKFVANDSHSKGFEASVTIVDDDGPTFKPVTEKYCHHKIEEETTILSVDYPENIPEDTRCTYTILAPENHQINLTFDHFHLGGESGCRDTYLQISHGNKVYRYCGHDISPGKQIISDGSEMVLYLVTDDGGSEGFEAEVNFFQPEETTEATPVLCDQVITKARTIETPMSLGYVPKGLHCMYHIKAPKTMLVRFTFISFHLAKSASDDCEDTFLEVRERNESYWKKYCGNDLRPGEALLSRESELSLYLQVNNNASKGFSGKVSFSRDIKASSGSESVLWVQIYSYLLAWILVIRAKLCD